MLKFATTFLKSFLKHCRHNFTYYVCNVIFQGEQGEPGRRGASGMPGYRIIIIFYLD